MPTNENESVAGKFMDEGREGGRSQTVSRQE
jgi:hypothetical protein